MAYSEHLSHLEALRRAYPDFLGGMVTLFQEAAKAEKLLANLDREKADRAKDLEAQLRNVSRAYEKAQQQLDAITPTLETRRRESNEEVARLKTALSEQEQAAAVRMTAMRQDMEREKQMLQAGITVMREEYLDVTAKLKTAKDQHAAFMDRLGAAAR